MRSDWQLRWAAPTVSAAEAKAAELSVIGPEVDGDDGLCSPRRRWVVTSPCGRVVDEGVAVPGERVAVNLRFGFGEYSATFDGDTVSSPAVVAKRLGSFAAESASPYTPTIPSRPEPEHADWAGELSDAWRTAAERQRPPPPARPVPRDELAQHRGPLYDTSPSAAAWVALNGKVYDVTQFAAHHPGGQMLLLRRGGTDVSEAFAESPCKQCPAAKILASCLVGSLAPQPALP
eukprot:TRINITY_DN60079_c0_g1_i1.p1 TRINITY_DN60079_c0_g1~~TRINITY_DN60079_c0_g1_i1.p1  ORF type:complete len:233 (+),score=52.59 TRINITY_DN60079_c0_g1_i1:102-800(+)